MVFLVKHKKQPAGTDRILCQAMFLKTLSIGNDIHLRPKVHTSCSKVNGFGLVPFFENEYPF